MPPKSPGETAAVTPLAASVTPTVRLVLTVFTMLATLMQALDSTIANIALPYMQGSLSASQEEINWVLTSYIVAAAIMTAPTGFLAARFGRTRLFVTAIIGFTIASIFCGASQTLGQIVLCRALQGVFGAALVPLSQSVMFDIYPVERRGPAMALWGMGVQIGPIIGPVLGGWLTAHYSWRWIFYINVPLGIAAAIGLLLLLKESPRKEDIKLDWIGFGALSIAIGAFQTMLDRGEQLDWFSSREIVVETCLAGLGFYIFLVQFWLAPKPFLTPKLFTDVNFIVGVTFIFVAGVILYATLALLAPYLQDLMNYPVITAGLVLAPRGIGTVIAMVVSGRLLGIISVRVLVGFGLATGAYALHAMTLWTPDVSEWTIVVVGFLQGLSIGFIFIPLSTASFSTLPVELRIEATGIYSLMRNLGSAIGIAVTGALLETNTELNHAFIAGAITPFNRVLQTGAAASFWNPASLGGATALDAVITRQASVIAYADDFKLMLILSIIVMPLVLLIRPVATKTPVAGPAPAIESKA